MGVLTNQFQNHTRYACFSKIMLNFKVLRWYMTFLLKKSCSKNYKQKIKRNVVLQQKLKSSSKSRVSERASFASHQASQAIQASQAKLVSRAISVFFKKIML